MQLKYLQTLLEAQNNEAKIVSLSWSPNNQKLAVATSDRYILLFDDKGERRDRFSTKPADPEAGKKSYVIKAIAFGPDSTKLAVAQSDCIVYVYKIGEKWGDKKAICNKFPQPSPVTCLIWLSTSPIICGLTDGKVRLLQVKSNKSQSLYASDSLVVSLCSNLKGTGFLSGHVDGNIIRFYTTNDPSNAEVQGRVILYPVPPLSLTWPQEYIFVAGCDKKVSIYHNSSKLVKHFDYIKNEDESDFTTATCSSSGQAVIIGSFDRLRLYIWNTRKSIWDESQTKIIQNLYTVTALAWKKDGSKMVCGSLCGVLMLFESVLKRTVWKDKYEITFVGPTQLLIQSCLDNKSSVTIKSGNDSEIDDVKIMGKDAYLVARTDDLLIVTDLLNNLTSQIQWNNSSRNEKFYFDYPTVCLVFNAGELTLIEYGLNDPLCSVRTEFANPHLISVRLNERNLGQDTKKLAYLLDLKTICIVDLLTGGLVAQITHDSKIDWLEMNETAHKLLFRDKKQRLILFDCQNRTKESIFTGVGFVQWVEGSDVAVAQANTNLAIWYNIELPQNPTIMQVKGDVIEIVRNNGKTEAVCVDGNSTSNIELDEGLVEFGTAINDGDFSRAVLFLESIDTNSNETEAMWHILLMIAVREQDIKLAQRCHAALGNVAASYYLLETIKTGEKYAEKYQDDLKNVPEVWANLSILSGDLNTAENIYLEQGDIDKALEMYQKLHKWEEALHLAESRGYAHFNQLKEQQMALLLNTGQYQKVGHLLEKEGKIEEALNMYMKSNKLQRVPTLVLQNPQLLDDHNLIAGVLKNLVKHEMFEASAEIYEKLDKNELALECYRKGKAWNKAVDLARSFQPDKVVLLEEEWGDYLVETKQPDAAISHYIEAGCTLKALENAVAAKQWKKAVHIIRVVDSEPEIVKYNQIIAQHFIAINDLKTAEKLYNMAGMHKEAIDMYNDSGQWEKAHSLASQYLEHDEVTSMYIKKAAELEKLAKYRDAERLYISINSPDLAIAMYKRIEQYENMIRLVEKYHPDLLHTTHLHLGQQLEAQGKYRGAEIHYLAVGEWKLAMNMYRTLGMWEEAYRVAKQNGGANAANQVAFLWAQTLPIDSAIKLLNKYGILDACIGYACDNYQFEFAFQLCKNLPNKVAQVHYKHAMALEDDGKFQEAENEFILAEKPKEAVLMYIHSKDWIKALRIAENFLPDSVPQVLQAQAGYAFANKEYSDFEVLLLRAQMPELIVQKYKNEDMWVDALRVCKDFLPHLYPNLQSEYSNTSHATHKLTNVNIETLLSKANEWALAGQHKEAVNCLLQVNNTITDDSIVKRALLRAADMINKFLFGQEALDLIRELAPRLQAIGEINFAAHLYMSVDLVKEAIDVFITAEEWEKARKIAKEMMEPGYESYVESKYKDRLLTKGDVEQLADVDLIGALDLLAEQGQWMRCIEKAKTNSVPILHKYVALYAAKLLRDGFVGEALELYATHGAPAMPQNFNIYTLISTEMFVLFNATNNYKNMEQLRQMLLEINQGLDTANVKMETKQHFKNLLLITHYYAVRIVCRQVPSLKSIAGKISAALLRYTDIIPADKAFYEAGKDAKDEGKLSEAFVFLNHYLDLCEAIEDGEGNELIDHSDLVQTDFPSSIPLPRRLYLEEDLKEHDGVREWILTISMDQRIDQSLPIDDSRQLFESCLQPGEQACIITGYPLKKNAISFSKSTLQANKDVWAKFNMAAKMAPESNIPSVLSFITKWCGTANSN